MNEISYCPNHPDKSIKCKGLCRKCYEKQLIENNPDYKKRQQENSKAWHKKNKKYKSEYDKKRRLEIGPQTEKRFFSHILKKFGLTKEQYDELVKKCANKCMLCSRPPHKGKRLHLDHNHDTGQVRGLLCTRCNWYLHTVEKDPDILNRIKKYLKNNGSK